ncbi:MAG: hypothetical protein ALAOOOJD_04382 [bacterium]|nr:hypothetical protein [bacterium]
MAQFFDDGGGVFDRVEPLANRRALNAFEIVADTDIEDRLGFGQRIVLFEHVGGNKHFDEHVPGNVLAQRLLQPQLLRPFDVVADIGHVDARPRDFELIENLHGFEL